MLADGEIQRILDQAMEAQFSKAQPATVHFFEHQPVDENRPGAVAIHQWAIAKITDADTKTCITVIANNAIKDVVSVSTRLMGEIVFRQEQLLPYQPTWNDGSPLFAARTAGGEDRFQMDGGNTVRSVGCFVNDILAAADRLADLDPKGRFRRGERLMLFCAKPLEKKLIRASAKAGIKCRVFGIRDYVSERSWVLTRAKPPCSLMIGKPSFPLWVKGAQIVVGARFVTHINDPRLAVCLMANPL